MHATLPPRRSKQRTAEYVSGQFFGVLSVHNMQTSVHRTDFVQACMGHILRTRLFPSTHSTHRVSFLHSFTPPLCAPPALLGSGSRISACFYRLGVGLGVLPLGWARVGRSPPSLGVGVSVSHGAGGRGSFHSSFVKYGLSALMQPSAVCTAPPFWSPRFLLPGLPLAQPDDLKSACFSVAHPHDNLRKQHIASVLNSLCLSAKWVPATSQNASALPCRGPCPSLPCLRTDTRALTLSRLSSVRAIGRHVKRSAQLHSSSLCPNHAQRRWAWKKVATSLPLSQQILNGRVDLHASHLPSQSRHSKGRKHNCPHKPRQAQKHTYRNREPHSPLTPLSNSASLVSSSDSEMTMLE